MPYISPAALEAMKTAGVPTTLKDGKRSIPLSPNQMALLFGLYNSIKGDNNVEAPWDVVYAKFRESFHVEEGLWVATEVAEPAAAIVPATKPAAPAAATQIALAEGDRQKTEPKILFGPGTFRSESGQMVTKSADDIAVMVQHFELLASRGSYPGVTKGHQKGSAAPKLGELRETWIDPAGNYITGPLENLTPELATSIEAGEFDNVSIEFSDHWWDADDKLFRDNVITGVAVLGGKWGAFKPPDKLTMARSEMSEAGGDDVNVYRLSMADMEGAPDGEGGEDVETIEGLKTRVAELEAEIKELKAAQTDEEKEALQAKVKELEGKLELATKAGEAAAEKIADAELAAKTTVVEGVLEAAVTADAKGNVKMTPNEADQLKPLMMAMDDSKTIKMSEGEDEGDPIMGSALDQFIATIEAREPVLKLSERSAAEGDPIHTGKPKGDAELPPETAKETEAREGMGYERQADGSWASPKKE